MAKCTLDVTDYLVELNKRLRAHPEFARGMQFRYQFDGHDGSAPIGLVLSGAGISSRLQRDVMNAMWRDFELEEAPWP
jgi:hypothetical protein